MKIGSFSLWTTAAEARRIGATHHGRFLDVVPGFVEPESGLWISRADWLAPLESLLAVIWNTLRALRGEDPDFMFSVGPRIAAEGEGSRDPH